MEAAASKILTMERLFCNSKLKKYSDSDKWYFKRKAKVTAEPTNHLQIGKGKP